MRMRRLRHKTPNILWERYTLDFAMEQLNRIYAKELDVCVAQAVTKLCHGCIVDHPSQHQHDVCLMMGREQQVDWVFEEALSMVDEDRIQSFLESLWGKSSHLKDPDTLKFILLHRECREIMKYCDIWQTMMKESLV